MPAAGITVKRNPNQIDSLAWTVTDGETTVEFATMDEAAEVGRNARTFGATLYEYWYGQEEAWVPTCSVCDGIHGTSYCPLEDRGWQDYDPREGF
jgi:hypothetical protein